MLCKKCSSEIPKGAKVCEKCGNPVTAETPAKNGPGRKKWIYGGAAAGIVLVVVLAVLLSGKAGGDLFKSPDNNNTSPSQTLSGDSAQPDNKTDSSQEKKNGKDKETSPQNKGNDEAKPNAPVAPNALATPEPTEEVIENYTDEYVFPYSDSEYLKKSDVKDLPPSTVSLGKDELYARYGLIFKDAMIQNHFDQCGWYTAIYTEEEWNELGDDYFFNKYEKKNLAFLEKWEKNELNKNKGKAD